MTELAFLIKENKRIDYSHFSCKWQGFAHIYACVVRIEDGQVMGICWSVLDKPTRNYESLTISCQIDNDEDDSLSYSWRAKYHDAMYIDLAKAESMTKTLRTIEKGLDKVRKYNDSLETFGDYLIAVANILKIKKIAFQISGYGTHYSDYKYEFEDVITGCYKVDVKIKAIKDELVTECKQRMLTQA